MDPTHFLQPALQPLQLALFNDKSLVIEIFDDVVVLLLVDLENDGFNGRVAFDQNACFVRYYLLDLSRKGLSTRDLPFTALGMFNLR